MLRATDVERMSTVKKEELLALIHSRAFLEGDYTLASGKPSRFYIDGKRVMFHPSSLLLLADAFMDAISDCHPDAVGGLEMGAIPIAAAVALRSAQLGQPISAFFVRKSPKGHGTNRFIEGCLENGARVVVCDDVITTGGSVLKAIEKVEGFGCEVVRVVCLVDREEGAVEEFAAKGYDYRPIFTLSELTKHARTT